jgi:hypothetical protein
VHLFPLLAAATYGRLISRVSHSHVFYSSATTMTSCQSSHNVLRSNDPCIAPGQRNACYTLLGSIHARIRQQQRCAPAEIHCTTTKPARFLLQCRRILTAPVDAQTQGATRSCPGPSKQRERECDAIDGKGQREARKSLGETTRKSCVVVALIERAAGCILRIVCIDGLKQVLRVKLYTA